MRIIIYLGRPRRESLRGGCGGGGCAMSHDVPAQPGVPSASHVEAEKHSSSAVEELDYLHYLR
jgi:hypothetical protein